MGIECEAQRDFVLGEVQLEDEWLFFGTIDKFNHIPITYYHASS
jgi:hypothetical protein